MTLVNGIHQGLVITPGLVGIGYGKLADGLVKHGATAHVATYRRCISTGTSMRAGQADTANAKICPKPFSIQAGRVKGALHILQLPPVVLGARGYLVPAQEDIGSSLHEALADHNPLGLAGVVPAGQIGGQGRWAGLLLLQDERIIGGIPFE